MKPDVKQGTAPEKMPEPPRAGDDLRLPDSLLTAEEHRELRETLRQCAAAKQNGAERAPGNTLLADGRHPYYPVYKKLAEIAKRHTDAGEPERCPLCGRPLTEENRSVVRYHSCICNACKLKICLQNRLPGLDNTRGYKHWRQMCVVCKAKRASPNRAGMCAACYGLSERYHTKDVRELVKLRLAINSGGNVPVEKKQLAEGFYLVRRAWLRGRMPASEK